MRRVRAHAVVGQQRARRRRQYAEYMASAAWHIRRRRWVEEEEQRTGAPVGCAVCGSEDWDDLHHLTYDRMGQERHGDMAAEEAITVGIRRVAAHMPTYITLKDVKKRWGYGQEDIFPVAQFEKLWGDMTALPDLPCGFIAVPRMRGQNLKDQAQLDGWLRDGSATYVESLCEW